MLAASRYEAVDSSSGWSRASKLKALVGVLALAVIVVVTVVAVASQSGTDSTTSSPNTYKTSSSCPLPRGISELTIRGRKVSMFVPDTIASGALPLILLFHGISSSPSDIEVKAHMQEKNNGRFIVAYPYGIGSFKAFNGAGCCDEKGPDDVGFARDVIQELEDLGCAEKYNAFVSGFSNGAFMTHKIGCEIGDRADGNPWVRAIAPHSGLLGSYNKTPYECKPVRHVPIMSFHGIADKTVPVSGANPNPLSSGVWKSYTATRDAWAAINGCSASNEVTRSPTTTCAQYSCPADGSVEFCSVNGLAHNWSGNERPTQDYDATSAFMNFFLANKKK